MLSKESGIDLSVLRCTFFRNFCPYFNAGSLVTDVWPLVANMVANICKMMLVDLPRFPR